MTVEKIFSQIGFIDEKTEVWIRDNYFRVITHGKWYEDNVLRYFNNEVESFTWEYDNNFYIDIK